MRLKANDLVTVHLRERIVTQDFEGGNVVTYSESPLKLQMNVQSAGGQVAAQIYGESLPYIKFCKYQGSDIKPNRNEKDGICLYVSKNEAPDYEILSIQTYSTHVNITLKKREI